MKKDPYSALSGLDQRLFQEVHEEPEANIKQGNKETSLSASKPASLEPSKEATLLPSKEPTQAASNQAGQPVSSEASKQGSKEATRPRVSSLRGQDAPRISERHTYDVFQDQVRWMSRLKLDVEELHNERVTINGIVQLALDLLREDYELNGERSHLIRVLVRGQPLRLKPVTGGKEEGG